MSSYEIRTLTDADGAAWDAFVASHSVGNGMVTTSARQWWLSNRWFLHLVAAFEGSAIVAGAAVVTKKMPHLPWSLARMQAILPDPRGVAETTADLLRAVEELARSERAAEIELRCAVPEGVALDGVEYGQGICEALERAGYLDSGDAFETYIVDVNKDDAALLATFEKECRRQVRVGARKGVEVVESRSPEDFQAMVDADATLRERKQLPRYSPETYEGFRTMLAGGGLKLFLARYEGQPCNLSLIQPFGIPCMMLLAVTPYALEKGVPATGEPFQYGAMKWFRDHGAAYYDLGGTPGAKPVKGHPNYTVWRFKYQFRGQHVRYLPYYRRSLGIVGPWIVAAARRLGRL